mgnify:CR=1 FL=1
MLPYPTIVIPGITATFLRDFYSLPPEYAWKVMPWTKDYDPHSIQMTFSMRPRNLPSCGRIRFTKHPMEA